MNLTYRHVQDQLRTVGIVMSKKGDIIRVNHFAGLEATASYSQSLGQALLAGMAMSRPKQLPRIWCETPRPTSRLRLPK